MKRSILIQIIVGVAMCVLLVVIVSKAVSSQDARAAIQTITWVDLALGVFAAVGISLLKAARFAVSLRFLNVQASFPRIASSFMASQLFTPLPGGELARGVLLHHKLNLEPRATVGPVLLQAMTELAAATCCVAISGLFISKLGLLPFAGLVAFLGILVAPFVFARTTTQVVAWIGNKLPWIRIKKIRSALQDFGDFFSSRRPASRLGLGFTILLLAIASQLVAAALLWTIARHAGHPLEAFQAVFAAALAVLIQGVLSLIPGGLGVTEGGLAGVLRAFGSPWSTAVIVTILFRLATFVLPLFIAALMFAALSGPKLFKKLLPS